MPTILDAIFKSLPNEGWRVRQLYIGLNWTISVVQNQAGEQRAGLAATPAAGQFALQSRFCYGPNPLDELDGLALAKLAPSSEAVEVAVGLATINALLRPDPALLLEIDAADWLVENGRDRRIALVGRFPFREELKPVAAQLWVLELEPEADEYGTADAPQLIPQAEIVAITGSTLVNHTLEGILALVRPGTKVMLLGPTTPLTPILFDFGLDLLSGVQVIDIEVALASIVQGVSFRKVAGVRRVTLQKLTR